MTILQKMNNRKGSAIVSVLSVILILTMLGTVVLIGGYYNVALSTNYRNWSEEFFSVDLLAEKHVKLVDKLLKQAETNAMAYFENEWYAINPDEFDPALYRNLSINGHRSLYNEYVDIHDKLMDVTIPDDTVRQNTYQAEMLQFVKLGFQKAYMFYAKSALDAWDIASEPEYTDANGFEGNNVETSAQLVTVLNTGGAYTPQANDLRAVFRVMQIKDGVGQRVTVQLNVSIPDVATPVVEYVNVPIKGNPVWTNAITAQGGIVFQGGTVDIDGDLYAASSVDGIQVNSGITLGIKGNISTAGDFRFIGNGVSNVVLGPYNSSRENGAKNKVYGHGGPVSNASRYFDINSSSYKIGIDNAITLMVKDAEGNEAMNPFPFDTVGGNVWCNSFSVEGNNKNYTQTGMLATMDDLQIDGENNQITLSAAAGSAAYVGLQSIGKPGDPNGSSSVINNTPESSSITIASGGIIVPGIAHLKFDKVATSGGISTPGYYATAESVSGRTIDSFSMYISDVLTGVPDTTYMLIDSTDGSEIGLSLHDNSDRNPFYEWFTDNEFTDSIQTGILLPENLEGFSEGIVLGQKGTSPDMYYDDTLTNPDVTPMKDYGVNKFMYAQKRAALAQAYENKTTRLGVADDLSGGMSASALYITNYLKKNALNEPDIALMKKANILVIEDGILNLNGHDNPINRIIYSTGDLLITGHGTINGSIICNGKVTIQQNTGDRIRIAYDEGIILRLLTLSASAKDVFAPGYEFVKGVAQDIYDATPLESYSISKLNLQKRYQVDEWVESYILP